MAVSYQQEDASTRCGGAGFTSERDSDNGGTAGSTPVTVNLPSSGTATISFVIAPNIASWPSGNYTVRLNVTTANMNVTWAQLAIERRDSTCVLQHTPANNVPALSLGSTGVQSVTISGLAEASALSSDLLVCKITLQNGAMSTQSFAFTPDQLIDTPLTGAPTISGNVTLSRPTISDTINVKNTISGTVSLASLTITDTIIHARQISGSVSLASPTISDTTKVIDKISGSVSLAALTITDSITVVAPKISGSITLPRPTISDSIGVVDKVSGSLSLLRPTITDSIKAVDSISGSLSLLRPTITDTTKAIDSVSGSLSLLRPTITGTTKALDKVSGSVSFLSPTIVDTITVGGGTTPSISGSIRLGSPTLSGSLTSQQPAANTGGGYRKKHLKKLERAEEKRREEKLKRDEALKLTIERAYNKAMGIAEPEEAKEVIALVEPFVVETRESRQIDFGSIVQQIGLTQQILDRLAQIERLREEEEEILLMAA